MEASCLSDFFIGLPPVEEHDNLFLTENPKIKK